MHYVHAIDYLVYGYMQTANALGALEAIEAITYFSRGLGAAKTNNLVAAKETLKYWMSSMLILNGDYPDALNAYQASLKINPHRLNSIIAANAPKKQLNKGYFNKNYKRKN
jgi:cytochrome c oxidase assembly factor CtaG